MDVPTKRAVLARVVDEVAHHAGVPKKLIKEAHKLKDDLDMNRQDLVRFSRALRDYMGHKVSGATPVSYTDVAKNGQTVGKVATLVHGRFRDA